MATDNSNKILSYLVTVRNLHSTTEERTLFFHFKEFGQINGKAKIKTHPNGKSIGYVYYKNLEDAKKACQQMNGKVIDGCAITTILADGTNTSGSFDYQKLTDCTFFKQGKCTKGSKCPYRHCLIVHDQECSSWKNGSCKKENCIYAHPSKKYSSNDDYPALKRNNPSPYTTKTPISFIPAQVRHQAPTPQQLQVDSPVDVLVEGKTHHAVVKWIGVMPQFPDTKVAGIELAQPIEQGNGGVFQGKRYFSCADKCGYFVEAKQCTLSLRKLSISSIGRSTELFICGYYLKNLCANAESCSYYHPSYQATYCWCYKYKMETGGSFRLCPKELNVKIEKAFSDPDVEDFVINDPMVVVRFDAKRTKFDNCEYNGKTAVFVRISTKSSAIANDEPHPTEWNWYWKDENGCWQYYLANTKIDKSIERSYQTHFSNSSKSKVPFSTKKFNYDLDFEAFFQKNLSTGTKREMRRRPKFVEFSTKKSEEDKSIVPKDIFPLHWPSDVNSVKLIALPNDVRSKIERKFAETMKSRMNYAIQSVEEVVNKELYIQYNTKRELMTNKLQNVNEMQLWHGTSHTIVDHIMHENFDWRLCNESVSYGKGSYFARDASYSNGYAHVDGSGVATMFLADVLVGEYCQGVSGMQRPPTKPGEKFVTYDSCVNNAIRPSIHIIFDFNQTYPRYIVKYKRVL